MSTIEAKHAASAEDLILAMDFAMDYFTRAFQDRQLPEPEHQELMRYYRDQRERARDHRPTDAMTLRPRDLCWSCRARFLPQINICPSCGAPAMGDRVERLRQLVFLCFEIKKHEKAARLTLAAAHGFLAEANERIAASRR